MSNVYPPYQSYPAVPPPTPPKRNRHWLRWILVGIVALAIAGGVGAAASGSKKHAATVATKSTSTVPSTTPSVVEQTTSEAPPPPAVPNPEGTVTGTCAYELTDDVNNYETHAADMNAEVDAENTGNIGLVLTVTMSYPQLAHQPIVMTKKVKVPYGQTVTVRFTKPMTQSQITRLQDWQSGHDYDDGCVYKGTITDTYGSAH
jgi:hypothetical protein